MKINSKILFALLLLFFVVLYFLVPKLLRQQDDVIYLDLVKDIFSKKYEVLPVISTENLCKNIFNFRKIWLVAVWASSKIAGTNIIGVTLPAMGSTLATATIVYKNSANHKLLITCIFLFSPQILIYSCFGTPDSMLMLFFTCAYTAVYRQALNKKNIQNALILSFSLFLGFLTKELIVFILPLLIFQFLTDIIKKINLRFWLISAILTITLFGLYFCYYKITTGNFLYRLMVFEKNQYVTYCSYDILPKIEVLKRIVLGFPFMIVSTLSTIIIIPFLFNNKSIKQNQLLLYFTILLLTANFASIKLDSYSPMCLEIRNYLYLLPIACITLSNFDLRNLSINKLGIVYGIFSLLSLIILYLKFWLHKDYEVDYVDIIYYLIPLISLIGYRNIKSTISIFIAISLLFCIYKQFSKYEESRNAAIDAKKGRKFLHYNK
jgi:4-amino-4-deoxy-L-arabinose transferase-like glycosyltransferase